MAAEGCGAVFASSFTQASPPGIMPYLPVLLTAMSQGVLQVTEGDGTVADAASKVEEETQDGDDLVLTGPLILRNRRRRKRRKRKRRSGRGFRVAGILGRAEELVVEEVGARLLQARQESLEAGIHKGAVLLVG